jgi:hypothetical protein
LSAIAIEAKENLAIEPIPHWWTKDIIMQKIEFETSQHHYHCSTTKPEQVTNENGTTKDYLLPISLHNQDTDTYTCPQAKH